MRNVQSLKNIGIFLENEEDSYYPDFVLWVKDSQKNKVYLNLIDPKGEMGIVDRETNELSDKVKIADKNEIPILSILESKIKELGYDIEINSFVILRQSSDYCKHEKDINILQNKLLKYNILRIDWHEEDEHGSIINNLINNKSYLDIMFEKIGIK
ncbi:hypothetical protein [Thermobrachium celere]|uniref:hypothetical protein n=1 Tax=Thermobrachium celere TaxID=53422 RepID=UPI00194093F5|nr:hypothetical protein [Thermobrachium celere]GFR36490.1 hypothetical protein TCEA9_23020 [Thermobrachium celere]